MLYRKGSAVAIRMLYTYIFIYIYILFNSGCSFSWMNFLSDLSEDLKSLLTHSGINFKTNWDNQKTTLFRGTILLLTNISITNSNHYQEILISEMYKTL